MKLYLNSVCVLIVSYIWSYSYYGQGTDPETLTRPFVYRQLVPLVSHIIPLTVVMTISGLGLYLALRKLYYHFYAQTELTEIYILVFVLIELVVCANYRKPYDLMVAWLMTVGIYLILTRQFWKYLGVLALASLNKETAFLLIVFFVVISFRDRGVWWMAACQVYVYGLITVCIRLAFSYAPGSGLWINPWNNVLAHLQSPISLICTLVVVVWLGFRINNRWMVHADIRKMFWVFVPAMLVAYIVCGQAYEFRSLWEIAPVLILLI